MVNNLFESIVIAAFGDDIADVISIYGNLFERLHINVDEYEEQLSSCDFSDVEELSTLFKRILIEEAKNNNIIPEEWDIEEYFSLYEDFSIICSDVDNLEEIEQVAQDFKDWTGIEIGILK